MYSASLIYSLIPYSNHFILIWFHCCSDTETLAQRVKRARASTSAEPPTSTPHASGMIFISPESSPQHSPHSSPQRKFVIYFLPVGVGPRLLIDDLVRSVGGEQQ